jgi:hypothetical protein
MKTKKKIKIGDKFLTGERHECTGMFLKIGVAEVLQNSFAYQFFGKAGFFWMSFDELEEKLEDGEWEMVDTEVIDLDKAEELEGVDDSEEFSKEELSFLKNVIIGTRTGDDETEHYLGRMYHKLSKMLKEKE